MEHTVRAVLAAFAGNLALAVLKGISAVATGSAAMLAETLHSIADTGNQVLLYVGLRLGRRPPHDAHPFGHGKNVYFWSFLVSVILFTLGGAFSIREGVHKLLGAGPHVASMWAFVVLGGAFVFESLSITAAIRALQRARGDTPLLEYWESSRDPALLTVVLEDSSAPLSIVLAAGVVDVDFRDEISAADLEHASGGCATPWPRRSASRGTLGWSLSTHAGWGRSAWRRRS